MRLTEPRAVASLEVLGMRVTVAVFGCRLTLISCEDDATAAADDADDAAALLAIMDTAGITCRVAFDVVTAMLPAPRMTVVRMTEDWTREPTARDVIKGRTTGTRDVPPRLMTTGPDVEVRMIASHVLPPGYTQIHIQPRQQ